MLPRASALLLALVLSAAPARADLAGYVARAEPIAGVRAAAEDTDGYFTVTTFDLFSQSWRGKLWRHELRVFRAKGARKDGLAVLAISGHESLGRELARRTGVPVATLSDVPNQPLFFGKREDDLLAHTFVEYLRSGDEEWPLLFPMTKAAVAAMDALEERKIASRFVVTGASKRGWTSWLAGVADERVAGIVPVVFDNLGFGAQMKHQSEVWGAYSDELSDYTLRGLQSQMGTERGAKLVAMVDPLAYGAKLGRFPKLVVNGSNDPYWMPDAIRFYWDALEGEKSILYVPNGDHGIAHDERVVAATAAFVKRVAEGRPMPKVELSVLRDGPRTTATIRGSEPLRAARVWLARGTSPDFRGVRFESIEAAASRGAFTVETSRASGESVAYFAEGDFGDGSSSFRLSTPLRIDSAASP